MSGNFLLTAGGLPLGLAGGGAMLLADQTVKVPRRILFENSTGRSEPESTKEETTGFFFDRLVDEDGKQVAKSIIQAVALSVVDKKSNALLARVDALDANGSTITEDELYTVLDWSFDLQVTRLHDRSQTRETHRAVFEFGWNASSPVTPTDVISTVASSTEATVTITGHGLSLTDPDYSHHIFIHAAATVGGVIVRGGYPVKSVDDTNTVTIILPCAAASTESNGGGASSIWTNGRVSKDIVELTINRDERYCA